HPRSGAVVVDLGSGSGDALAAVVSRAAVTGVGIDISAAAAAHAARRWPAITWVVANADRRLPLADGSADVVMSLHARRNPPECARVLAPGGTLIVAVPAADDLAELRAAIQGEATPRDRVSAVVEEHAGLFSVEERFAARETRDLDAAQVQALLRATYRGARTREAARAATLTGMTVTLASDGMVLERC
ncbi:MAG: methyltransferase domain-containing protein, partial [Acidobacteria bacterium]|nr:methyltransferase domain-containing protein [Acidobacteriota bacterium]